MNQCMVCEEISGEILESKHMYTAATSFQTKMGSISHRPKTSMSVVVAQHRMHAGFHQGGKGEKEGGEGGSAYLGLDPSATPLVACLLAGGAADDFGDG